MSLLLLPVTAEIPTKHSPCIKCRIFISDRKVFSPLFCVWRSSGLSLLATSLKKSNSDVPTTGMVMHFSRRLNLLTGAKCWTAMQICIECKDFDLDKTHVLQNSTILGAIKICINKDDVCTGKLFLLLLSLSPHPLVPPQTSTAYVIAAARRIFVAFGCCHLHNKAAIQLYHFWAFRSGNRCACSWKPKKVPCEEKAKLAAVEAEKD